MAVLFIASIVTVSAAETQALNVILVAVSPIYAADVVVTRTGSPRAAPVTVRVVVDLASELTTGKFTAVGIVVKIWGQ